MQEDSLNESILTVRLYGPNTDLVIDRERELNVSMVYYFFYFEDVYSRNYFDQVIIKIC